MLGYVASFLALISLLVNSSVGCCRRCLPCPISSAVVMHAGEGCHDESCCHSDEDEGCDEHAPDQRDVVDSGCGSHSHDSDCPCRPGRCVHATIATGITPQSTFPEWVCCRSCTAISDLSKPIEPCSLTRHRPGNDCCLLSASFVRAKTQVWLI
jgi:hypothetical protein